MMLKTDSISTKLTLDLLQVQWATIMNKEMTQGILSGSPDYIPGMMEKKKKQFCLSINAHRKISNNFILLIKSLKVILIVTRILFTALTGQMTQKLDQNLFKNQNFCMYHVIMYTLNQGTQMIQYTKNAYQILKLNNNTLVRCKYLCISTKKF